MEIFLPHRFGNLMFDFNDAWRLFNIVHHLGKSPGKNRTVWNHNRIHRRCTSCKILYLFGMWKRISLRDCFFYFQWLYTTTISIIMVRTRDNTQSKVHRSLTSQACLYPVKEIIGRRYLIRHWPVCLKYTKSPH